MKKVNALSLYELTKYVRAVAQEAGLSVATSDKGYSYLQNKTIYIAPERMPLDQESAVYQLRKIIHEVAHYTDTDMDLWQKAPCPQNSLLRTLWNMVEDHRIEHIQSHRYDGDADILDAGTAVAMSGALKSAEQATAKLSAAELDKLSPEIANLALDAELRSEWQPSLVGMGLELNAKQRELYGKMAAYKEDIRRARQVEGKLGTAIAYSVAKKLFEACGGDVEKEEARGKKEQEARAKAEGEGRGKANKGSGTSETINEKDSQSEKTRKELSLSPQDEGTNPHFDHNFSGGAAGRLGTRGRSAMAALPEHFYVENYANPHKNNKGGFDLNSGMPERGRYTRYYGPEIASARAAGSSSEQLAQKMRRLVQIKTRSRTQYALKSGKLHGASLHRIAANVPGYSERVFKQRIDNFDIDSAVCVCVDMSGSMGGSKMLHAAIAAEMLNDTVGNVLRVPLMVYGFSETRAINGSIGPSPSVFVLRDFNEQVVPVERFRQRTIDAITCTMGNNPDADAVIWGYHQLRAAKGKRKVLFVLSDGSPASGRAGDQGQYLKAVCGLIEKSPIRLFGLGLEDRSVERYYKNNAVVTDATQIENRIIQLVDNFILEGK